MSKTTRLRRPNQKGPAFMKVTNLTRGRSPGSYVKDSYGKVYRIHRDGSLRREGVETK